MAICAAWRIVSKPEPKNIDRDICRLALLSGGEASWRCYGGKQARATVRRWLLPTEGVVRWPETAKPSNNVKKGECAC